MELSFLSVYILAASLVFFSCDSSKFNEIPDPEGARAQAFMSGQRMINGTWQRPPPPRNMIGHDYSSAGKMPYILQGSSHGSRYLWEMANMRLEPDHWKVQWEKAQETLKTIREQDYAPSIALLNYEMVAFTFIKYYLNEIEPNGEMASASAYLLDLLLEHETRGELDLLAEHVVRISDHLSPSEVETFTALIRKQSMFNIGNIDDDVVSLQLKKRKSSQAMAILEGRKDKSIPFPQGSGD